MATLALGVAGCVSKISPNEPEPAVRIGASGAPVIEIRFHGVVWNQFDETVPEAEIIARFFRHETGRDHAVEIRLRADGDGRFTVMGEGDRVEIEARAEGHFPSRPSVFTSEHSGSPGSDPDDPVVLTLIAR